MAVHEHPLEHQETIIATGVSFEDWLRGYDDTFTELDNGVVIQMSPVRITHSNLSKFLLMFIEAYLSERPIGIAQPVPFAMKTGSKSGREPDIRLSSTIGSST
jgi:Uma2 family endonuclease